MVVTSTILKEKKISVNQIIPTEKMHIKVERTNLMPETVDSEKLQSELKLEIRIIDDKNVELVNIVLSYVVLAIMDKDEVYDKDKAADNIFTFLKSMFFSSANELIGETNYPPFPLNINC